MRKCRLLIKEVFKLCLQGKWRICVWLGNDKACDNMGNIFNMPVELVNTVDKDISITDKLKEAFDNVADKYNAYVCAETAYSCKQYEYLKEGKQLDTEFETLFLACEDAQRKLNNACRQVAKAGVIYETDLNVHNFEYLIKNLADYAKVMQIKRVDNAKVGIAVMSDIVGNTATFVLQIKSYNLNLQLYKCNSFYLDIEPQLKKIGLHYNLGIPVQEYRNGALFMTQVLQINITGDYDFVKIREVISALDNRRMLLKI